MTTLSITEAQTTAMAMHSYRRFEDRVFATIASHYPETVAVHGEPGIRRDIRDAVLVADGIGLRSERSAAYYVLMTFLLGRDFDARPEHQRVANILRDASRSPEVRAQHAYELVTGSQAGSPP